MSRSFKIGGILLVAVALVVAGALFLRQQSRTAAAEEVVPTTTTTRGYIEETVSATGNVVAASQATLAFKQSGPIAEVLVEEGQRVEAGQVLARLDTASLEWQVVRAQASLDTARARLEQARQPASTEDLASAQAALDSARANYDSIKAGPSQEDIASSRAALDSARANYDKVRVGPTQEELASAKAALDSARAALQQAQAAYDRVKDRPDIQMRQESLNLQNATISLEQAQANYDALANRPTASDLSAAKAQVAQAEAQLAQLLERPISSEVAAAEAQVAQAEATLAQLLRRPSAEDIAVQQAQVEEASLALAQAQEQLEDALLRAPFAGAILTVQVNDGEWATPGAPAIVLAVTEPLILDVNVDEVDVAQLERGQGAHLSIDAFRGEEISGTVTSIAPASTNVSGAVAYRVKISLDPGPLAVRLGMTADVEIVVASATDALLVPNRAVTADRAADRYYVSRQLADGTIQRLEVRIGLRSEEQTQILEGLEEGDRLVLPEIPERGQDDQRFGPPGGGGGPFGGNNQ